MSTPSDLYQARILDHARSPRNARVPESASHRARRDNPLCGDRIELGLAMDGEVITAAGFRGHGCAIAKASASLMTEAIQGKTAAQARALSDAVHALVSGGSPAQTITVDGLDGLGELDALGGVAAFPMRIQCATLAWQTLVDALDSVVPTSACDTLPSSS